MPASGWVELEDGETGKMLLINTGSLGFRSEYERLAMRRQSQLDLLFKLTGIDAIKIEAGGSYVKPLIKFFRKREQRR